MAGYLIDLDGTVYRGRSALPGAGEFLRWLQNTNQPYRFLTNAPEYSPRQIEKKLLRMGLPIRRGDVITSGTLAVEYILELSPTAHPTAAVFGTAFLKRYAALRGLRSGGAARPDFLLMSFGENLTMGEVWQACRLIRQGAAFIATNPDDLLPTEDGPMPHLGGILQAMAAATGVEPLIAGKPASRLRDYFVRSFRCPAEEIIMIGDRLDTDMGFARSCGFQAWLVLTGSTSREAAAMSSGSFDRCFAGLKEAAESLMAGR